MERLDFVFNNQTGNKTTFELFNSLNTFSQIQNRSLITPLLNFLPFSIYPPPLDTNMKDSVLFDKDGNLFVTDSSGIIACSISCTTYPYRAVINALLTTRIMIKRILIKTSSNTSQLISPIERIETQPLTNNFKKDFYPVTISPFVVQPLLNEFIKDIYIDAKSGLLYTIYPNEIVNWTIEFEFIN